MLKLVYTSDPDFHEVSARVFSDTIYDLKLAVSTEQHITIPIPASRCFFKYSYTATNGTNTQANVYVKLGTSGVTATIPSANIVDGTGSEINPTGYSFKPADTTMSFISDAAVIVSLAFYL